MSLNITPKMIVVGAFLATIIAFGTIYVTAQNGSNSGLVTYSDEITLQGTVLSVDEDHGFTMIADSVTYYVGIPYTYDKAALGITVGSDVTVTGYIVTSPMMDSSSYIMFHAETVNGVVIEHNSQNQARSGDCGGMGGNGRGRMGRP